jgi:hypothetical protein
MQDLTMSCESFYMTHMFLNTKIEKTITAGIHARHDDSNTTSEDITEKRGMG